MVGGLFDLLGSGSTMPQRGIALPLIAFFAAVPTPVVISNQHHLFVQIVIEIIQLPAPETIRAIIIGTSRAPPPSPPVMSSLASSFFSQFCLICRSRISLMAFLFSSMAIFSLPTAGSSSLFLPRHFFVSSPPVPPTRIDRRHHTYRVPCGVASVDVQHVFGVAKGRHVLGSHSFIVAEELSSSSSPSSFLLPLSPG